MYQQVTRFIPLEFPLLIIVPAFLLDCVRAKLPEMNRWLLAIILGSVFLTGLVAVQWPFADFLLSPWARNWFFGAQLFALFRAAHLTRGHPPVLSGRDHPPAILGGDGGGVGGCHPEFADRAGLWRLVAEGPPLERSRIELPTTKKRSSAFLPRALRRARCLLPWVLLVALPAAAHVGSPDVFYEGDAGPYHLFVTVRVPQVVPGVAEVEIRSQSNDVTQVQILALRLDRGWSSVPALCLR